MGWRVRASWLVLVQGCVLVAACAGRVSGPPWEAANPLVPLPEWPAGVERSFDALPEPPTPATVRLGRWLFFDTRLSADGTIACGTCHRPEHAFSEPTPVSTGIRGQKGTRKANPIVNLAWVPGNRFFWDGRASSLEEQAVGPITNPIEMGHTAEGVVAALEAIPGYRPYFADAFGDDRITIERVTRAIADYERTRLAGNSVWDRWRRGVDERLVTDEIRLGTKLFFGRAACNQCHLGQDLTDGQFHNTGIGWDAAAGRFADEGRAVVTARDADRGAFKTPSLRDVARHAPYMHDGSIATLREVVELYNRGGTPNPFLSAKVFPLGLTDEEIDALVAFMEALSSDVPFETPPTRFPQ